MYFGLYNSPGTFQRMINSIFQKLLHEGVLANYMDDFVIPAKTMEELEERTVRFLKIAEKHNLCFKQSKYDFNIEEIPILEVIAGKGQVKMEQEKIKVVKEWKTPTRVKDVCYGTLGTWTIFIFLFLLFSDFIGILFSFSFYFGR